MKLRRIAMALVCASLPGISWAAPAPSAEFHIQQATVAPGTVLQPGNYSIQVVDHLRDRFLVRVEGGQGTVGSLFIAVPSKALGAHPGMVTWNAAADGETALRGYVFKQKGSALEFVYPKDEAVSLAKANGVSVLAVDPASEGKAPQLAKLSHEEMQLVTLWTLTPERVGAPAKDVTISAKRYVAPETSATEQAAANPPAVLKRLPHTASLLPWVMILGMLASFGACLMRIRRGMAV